MPIDTFHHPLFGDVTFKTDHDTKWIRGDAISFLSGFDSHDVVKVAIPQLVNIPGARDGVVSFHRKGHAQLLRAFKEIEAAGLLHHINNFSGAYHRRLRKPTNGEISKLPSQHAFGIAIDLNGEDPGFGASVAPLAPVFQQNGFLWGKEFPHPDPMHFEIKTFMP